LCVSISKGDMDERRPAADQLRKARRELADYIKAHP